MFSLEWGVSYENEANTQAYSGGLSDLPPLLHRQFASMKKEEVLDQMQTELARNRGKEERSDEMDEGTAERH